jgi:transaldolase
MSATGKQSLRLDGLTKLGQSLWLDSISRELMDSGELKNLIEVVGIRGMTSNPTIFEKAINGSPSYDNEIALLSRKGYSTEQIVRFLMVRDIRRACDYFLPLHKASDGNDGFVSIEVSPLLSRETKATISEAKLLHALVDHSNLMVKVPGTPEGMPAIEELTSIGISINVTLLFSPEAYRNAAMAYVKGLSRFLEKGGDISRVHSVASVFVSRIDTMVDRKLSDLKKPQADALKGRLGIENCRTIYAIFEEIFKGEFTQKLASKGGNLQRPLWASTGTKNPDYSDVLYVDSLIAPDTVNTVPMATLKAFVDHGKVSPALLDKKGSDQVFYKELASFGISCDQVFQTLLEEGLKAFEQSFETLNSAIQEKIKSINPGQPSDKGVAETQQWADEMKALIGTWEKTGVPKP